MALATSQHLVQVALGQSGESARLGDGRDTFDSVLGEGIETNHALIQYGSTNDDDIVYLVRFNDDVADHIEIDFTGLPDGGLSEADANVGESRFLPDDSEQVSTFRAGNLQFETSGFDLATWSSSTLANATGQSEKMIVIDEHNVPGDGASSTTTYERALVSMEGNDVYEVDPSGTKAVLTAPLDIWWEQYGQAPASQRASHVADPSLEAMTLGISLTGNVVAEIDFLLDEGIPTEMATNYVGCDPRTNPLRCSFANWADRRADQYLATPAQGVTGNDTPLRQRRRGNWNSEPNPDSPRLDCCILSNSTVR
ncbi:MAG: hypothetical protein WKF81_07025 [Thermomicrobiales bacterium]